MLGSVLILIFIGGLLAYVGLGRYQLKLVSGERLIHTEDNVKQAEKILAGVAVGIGWNTLHVDVTNKRVIEKASGMCKRSITLNPDVKDAFGIINVLHADTAMVKNDEEGKECLELTCQSGNITRHFRVRYYFKDFSTIRVLLSG